MTNNNNINTALDSVLSAGGVDNLKPANLKRMREAMRKVMNDRYISGWNDGNSDARDNVVLND